ncbi:hypothetical protein [Paludisphaera borealis]|uniref:Uncharacterized protein n=1 Tax=Paludisphaera borealis TaxID=1387353 RepID=A0A1U7CN79_9BACT|nr:hypothetical protein [Paludisphaera borealis]APW60395.1 hypothetical protein BSF38_01863 [Paludisphaera borealis]
MRAVLAASLGARRLKQDDAAKVLLDAADWQADKTHWPYPVVSFPRREIDEKALHERATGPGMMADVRFDLALDQLIAGWIDEAKMNLRWIKDGGGPKHSFYRLALAELEELEATASPVASGR